jgi:hypothetical protein
LYKAYRRHLQKMLPAKHKYFQAYVRRTDASLAAPSSTFESEAKTAAYALILLRYHMEVWAAVHSSYDRSKYQRLPLDQRAAITALLKDSEIIWLNSFCCSLVDIRKRSLPLEKWFGPVPTMPMNVC